MRPAKFFLKAPLFVAMLCGCATHNNHAAQRNSEIIHRYFKEWANHGDAVVADQLIAANLVLRNPPAVIRSLADYKNGMVKFLAATQEPSKWKREAIHIAEATKSSCTGRCAPRSRSNTRAIRPMAKR